MGKLYYIEWDIDSYLPPESLHPIGTILYHKRRNELFVLQQNEGGSPSWNHLSQRFTLVDNTDIISAMEVGHSMGTVQQASHTLPQASKYAQYTLLRIIGTSDLYINMGFSWRKLSSEDILKYDAYVQKKIRIIKDFDASIIKDVSNEFFCYSEGLPSAEDYKVDSILWTMHGNNRKSKYIRKASALGPYWEYVETVRYEDGKKIVEHTPPQDEEKHNTRRHR